MLEMTKLTTECGKNIEKFENCKSILCEDYQKCLETFGKYLFECLGEDVLDIKTA